MALYQIKGNRNLSSTATASAIKGFSWPPGPQPLEAMNLILAFYFSDAPIPWTEHSASPPFPALWLHHSPD